MRNVFIALLWALLMAYSSTPIAHGHGTGLNSAATGSMDTSGADLIVVNVGWYNGVTANGTLSDSKGNTWTPCTKTTIDYLSQQLFYCQAPTVGSGHTFTYAGSIVAAAIEASAWSGSTSSPLDTESHNSGAGVTSMSCGSLGAPANNGSLLIAGLCADNEDNPADFSIDSSFTITDADGYTGGDHEGGAMAYLVQGTAAGVTATWSWNTSSGRAIGAAASFKPASGGGGTIVSEPIRRFVAGM